jgi:hypothetical protein
MERTMGIRKISIAGLALAVAVAFSPLPELQAAPFTTGSQPTTDNLLQSVKTKKKGAKKKAAKKRGKRKAGKKKASAASASCGTYKYRKGGKCLDARDKK